MANIDPDTLLKKVTKSGMSGDMLISIIIHILLVGLTSFGLYASWAKWGVHAPNEIKRLEKEAAKEEAKKQAAAKAEAEAKAAAEAAAKEEEEKAAKKPGEKAAAKEAVRKVNDDAAKAAAREAGEKAVEKAAGEQKPQALPLDQQVEKPPKSFDLDGVDL